MAGKFCRDSVSFVVHVASVLFHRLIDSTIITYCWICLISY